jgi:hypothetical protein
MESLAPIPHNSWGIFHKLKLIAQVEPLKIRRLKILGINADWQN